MENNIPIYMKENIHIYSKCADCVVHKMIELRAYEIWDWRQEWGYEGTAEQDWLEAEGEILEKLADKSL